LLAIFFTNSYSMNELPNLNEGAMSNQMTTTNVSPPVSGTVNATPTSAATNVSATADVPLTLANALTIASQVLAHDKNSITFSMPGQPPLTVAIDQQQQQVATLAIGQKVELRLISDGKQLLINIEKLAPPPISEGEVPLSRDLAQKLAQSTVFPKTQQQQQQFIEKHQPLNIGLARRLPGEQVKLVANSQVTINAALPGSSNIALNQTFTLELSVNDKGKMMVAFVRLPAPQQALELTTPLAQVKQQSPQLDLTALPLNRIKNIDSLKVHTTEITTKNLQGQATTPDIDMDHPRNKLWIRQQSVEQVFTALATQSKEFVQLSATQISLQNKLALSTGSAQEALAKEGVAQTKEAIPTLAKETVTPTKEAPAALTKEAAIPTKEIPTKEIPATLAKEILTPTKEAPAAIAKDTAMPIKEATATLAKEAVAPTKEATAALAKEAVAPTKEATAALAKEAVAPTKEATAALAKEAVAPTKEATAALTKEAVAPTKEATAALTKEAVAPTKEASAALTKDTATLAKETAVPTKEAPAPTKEAPAPTREATAALAKETAVPIKEAPAPTREATAALAKETAVPIKEASAALAKEAPSQTKETAMVKEPAISKVPNNKTSFGAHHLERSTEKLVNTDAAAKSADLSKPATHQSPAISEGAAPKVEDPSHKASMPLKQLSAILASLQLSRPSTQPTPTAAPAQEMTTNANDDVSAEHLAAIDQLKVLTKKVPQQLPNMQQLTTPVQLAHVISQFSSFSSLAPSSINLSALGPLASALQLILGAKSAAANQELSPALKQHMLNILKKPNAKLGTNLAQALQMLGNLSSLKPLEEALTSLSGNITLYQYQNQESSSNNQALFYFSLPTSDKDVEHIEGEIEQQGDEATGKTWRLTLLLPAGEQQKIKAIASLYAGQVDIELVCNNPALLDRVSFYQQFLGDRLDALGFADSKVTCRQGDIAKSLLKRPNQLVELIV